MAINDGYVHVVNIFFYIFRTFLGHFLLGLKCPKMRRIQSEKPKKPQSKWKCALQARNHSWLWLCPHELFSLQWTSPYTICTRIVSTILSSSLDKNGTKCGSKRLYGVWNHPLKWKKCTGRNHNHEWFLACKAHFHLLLAFFGFFELISPYFWTF